MKRSGILNYSLFFSLLFFGTLFSEEVKKEVDQEETALSFSIQPEIAVLQELISSTKNTLQTQENLLNLVLKYQETRSQFCMDSENRRLAGRLVRSAAQIAEILTENHLAHLFPKNFLEEIDFFARLRNNPQSESKL